MSYFRRSGGNIALLWQTERRPVPSSATSPLPTGVLFSRFSHYSSSLPTLRLCGHLGTASSFLVPVGSFSGGRCLRLAGGQGGTPTVASLPLRLFNLSPLSPRHLFFIDFCDIDYVIVKHWLNVEHSSIQSFFLQEPGALFGESQFAICSDANFWSNFLASFCFYQETFCSLLSSIHFGSGFWVSSSIAPAPLQHHFTRIRSSSTFY